MSIKNLARYIRVLDKAVARETAESVVYRLKQPDPKDLGLRKVVERIPSIRSRAARRAVADAVGDATAKANRKILKSGGVGVVRLGKSTWMHTSKRDWPFVKMNRASVERRHPDDRILLDARKELRGKTLATRAWRGEDPTSDAIFSTDAGWFGRGRYFSGLRGMTTNYNKGRLVDADLKFNNPLYVLKTREHSISSDVLGGITEIDGFGRAQRMTDIARKRGHDAVVKLTKVDMDEVADAAKGGNVDDWVSPVWKRKNDFGVDDIVAADEIVVFDPESMLRHRIPGKVTKAGGGPKIVLGKTVEGSDGRHIPPSKEGIKKHFTDMLDRELTDGNDDRFYRTFQGGYIKGGKPAVTIYSGGDDEIVLTRDEAVAYINRAIDHPASVSAARKSLYSMSREVQNYNKNMEMVGLRPTARNLSENHASDVADEIMGNETFKLTNMSRLGKLLRRAPKESRQDAKELYTAIKDVSHARAIDAGMPEAKLGSTVSVWETRRRKYGKSGLSQRGRQSIVNARKQ